jgi:NADP-dependent 3-hydroxy acid dehydrogenase YdfG
MSENKTARAVLNSDDLIVITGAGGFIAGALTGALAEQGFTRIRRLSGHG